MRRCCADVVMPMTDAARTDIGMPHQVYSYALMPHRMDTDQTEKGK